MTALFTMIAYLVRESKKMIDPHEFRLRQISFCSVKETVEPLSSQSYISKFFRNLEAEWQRPQGESQIKSGNEDDMYSFGVVPCKCSRKIPKNLLN